MYVMIGDELRVCLDMYVMIGDEVDIVCGAHF